MPPKPLLIGITGGIGSGKSIICKIFAVLGAPIYEADSRAKWLMVNDLALREAIKVQFGEASYLPDNQLNRPYLAAQVFNDSDKVKLMNSLVHPRVGEDYQNWVQNHQNYPYLLNEAALMFESGRYLTMDKIITVFAPIDLRIKRISQRDPQRTPEEIGAIIQKQMPEDDKIARAHYAIYNDDQQLVIPQVLALHQRFLGELNT
ncbi:MAG: dephospho-CoA kinase [Microscillaceae bacterium]|jgi:dephospho-CoA kinase|nr:dephospho-CoA kinase [Microscillaceae bacterium]